jgi:energy-coupling factor transport system permease protein
VAVERIHPGAWIVWAAGAAMVAFVTTNPFLLAVLVAAVWLVHAAHRRSGPASRSFRVFLLAGLAAMLLRTALVFFSTVNPSSVAEAMLEGARLAAILVVFGAFNSVSDPSSVLRLAPRRFHEPALAAALALSIAPRTMDEVARVREAQMVRGIRVRGLRTIPALAVPVLENGMEGAVGLAESMDSRGHGRGPRSRYRPQSWGWASTLVATGGACAGAVYLTAALAGLGDLQPSTFPLAWPQVSPLLVAAACLVALPGVLGRRGAAP